MSKCGKGLLACVRGDCVEENASRLRRNPSGHLPTGWFSGENVVTKSQLLAALRPSSFVKESSLTQCIFQLRKALGESPGREMIETLPKRGFRIALQVDVLPPAPATRSRLFRRLFPAATFPRRPKSTERASESLRRHNLRLPRYSSAGCSWGRPILDTRNLPRPGCQADQGPLQRECGPMAAGSGSPRSLGDLSGHAADWSREGTRIASARGLELFVANADGSGSQKIARAIPALVPRWQPAHLVHHDPCWPVEELSHLGQRRLPQAPGRRSQQPGRALVVAGWKADHSAKL